MEQDIKISVKAGEDLSAAQFTAIEIDGTVAATAAVTRGILQNKPKSGENAALTVIGRSKFKAGGTIAAGNNLTIADSGFLVATSSGDNSLGFSIFAVASGGITEGVFNIASPRDLA